MNQILEHKRCLSTLECRSKKFSPFVHRHFLEIAKVAKDATKERDSLGIAHHVLGTALTLTIKSPEKLSRSIMYASQRVSADTMAGT